VLARQPAHVGRQRPNLAVVDITIRRADLCMDQHFILVAVADGAVGLFKLKRYRPPERAHLEP
jgi:hypothetical protein